MPFRSRRKFIATTALGAVGSLGILRGMVSAADGPNGPSRPAVGVALNGHGAMSSLTLQDHGGNGAIMLGVSIDGYRPVGEASLDHPGDRILELRQSLATADGLRCEVMQRFSQVGAAEVRWQVEIRSSGPHRTAPVHMAARFPASKRSRFWTAWSDPDVPSGAPPLETMRQWTDPLVLTPFSRRHFFYGAPAFNHGEPMVGFSPVYRDLISLPLASFLEPEADTGATLVLSPEAGDGFLDLTLDTDESGLVDFAFLNHRFDANRPLRFEASLIGHEAGWRGGLRWMTERHARYFNPSLPLADALGGTAAFSSERAADIDAEKLRRMDFNVNWMASFDFPYMGMFLPPVGDAPWEHIGVDGNGHLLSSVAAADRLTSVRALEGYSERMRALGFHVLAYFNTTEFGADIVYPPPPRTEKEDKNLWRNANDFLYGRLEDSIIRVPSGMSPSALRLNPGMKVGGPFYTWGDGIVLDCGDAAYATFLLAQAKELIERLPASSGICIDRMDWLRFYNEDRDDGLSWFGGRPSRSLYNSWRALTEKLLPLFHDAGKVVFVNNHLKRIDLLRDVDGIFDEFAVSGASLNLTALMSVRRPALGWTTSEESLGADPNAFFQRFLYMGVFPMAPFPDNHHSIVPSAWADRQYMDYGPLLKALNGRKWVLEPHAVEVPDGGALANAFSVDGGYAFPVVLGGSRTSVRVSVAPLPGIENLRARALHPGSDSSAALNGVASGGRIEFDVPLSHGCAVLLLRTPSLDSTG